MKRLERSSQRGWSAFLRRLRIRQGRPVPQEDENEVSNVSLQDDDEVIQLCDLLIEELSRPSTEEEITHGWSSANQARWRRWVEKTRDQALRRVIPARTAAPIEDALSMTGVLGYDSRTCKLTKLEFLIDDRISRTTGEGIQQMRKDLLELADLTEEPATAARIRSSVRDVDGENA